MEKKQLKNKGQKVKKSEKKCKQRRQKFSIMNYRVGRVLTCAVMFLGISAVCLFLSSTVLFSIKEIVVQGDDIYESQFIIEKSDVNAGDNLFLLNSEQVAHNLETKLAEVDEVSIHKKFPSRLIINVKRAQKKFAIEVDGKFILVSSKGKVLDISDVYDEDLILLKGVSIESFEVGAPVVFVDNSIEKRILEFLEQMEIHNLKKVSGIDFSVSSNFVVYYDNRIKIDFGFYENMDYKIRTAAEIINNKLGVYETGELDLAEVVKENRSYFTPAN